MSESPSELRMARSTIPQPLSRRPRSQPGDGDVTWSIVARDPDSGAVGVAVATRFLAAAGLCLNAASGVGALSTQAMINPTYETRGLQLLREARSADEVVADLVGSDLGRNHRQVHAVDALGRTGAHTGEQCLDWAGHLTDDGVSVAGNLLSGPGVVEETLRAYQAGADQPFAERLITALLAGQRGGGDARGQQSAGLSSTEPRTIPTSPCGWMTITRRSTSFDASTTFG